MAKTIFMSIVRVWCTITRRPAPVHEIAEAAKASCDTVKRAIIALESSGLVVRDGGVIRSGQVAPTFRLAGPGDAQTTSYRRGRVYGGQEAFVAFVAALDRGATRPELCEELGKCYRSMTAALTLLQRGDCRRIRIGDWRRRGTVRGQHYPVYVLGNSADAKRPERQPDAVYRRRTRARRALLNKGAGFSVFSAHAFQQMQGAA